MNGRKEELEIKIESVRKNLELLEKELWEINTLEWCKEFVRVHE